MPRGGTPRPVNPAPPPAIRRGGWLGARAVPAAARLDRPLLSFLARRVVPGVEEVEGATSTGARRSWPGARGRAPRSERPPATGAPSSSASTRRDPRRWRRRRTRVRGRCSTSTGARGGRQAVLGKDPLLAAAAPRAPRPARAGRLGRLRGAGPRRAGPAGVGGGGGAARRADRGARRFRPGGAGGCAEGSMPLFPRPGARSADPGRFPFRRSRGAALVALGWAGGGLRSCPCPRRPGGDAGEAARAPASAPGRRSSVAMRALRERDAFPAGDLGRRRSAARGTHERPRRGCAPRPGDPGGAYAAQHLWVMDAERRP